MASYTSYMNTRSKVLFAITCGIIAYTVWLLAFDNEKPITWNYIAAYLIVVTVIAYGAWVYLFSMSYGEFLWLRFVTSFWKSVGLY